MPDRVTVPACTAVARVMHPGSTKYTFGFETGGVDSWAGFIGASLAVAVGSHRGNYAGLLATVNGTTTITRTLTGLTIGRRYRLTAWAGTPVGVTTLSFAVGVSGIGTGTAVLGVPIPTVIATFKQVSFEFVATATSHSAQLIVTDTGVHSAVWDDILLQELEYQVGADIPLALEEAGSTVTLDETRAPYASATLAIALPEQADLDLLDTRTTNSVRVIVTASQTGDLTQTRTFDLVLHERDADHAEGEQVTLTCRSDEAFLIDAGNDTAAVDSTMQLDQKSLRAIIATLLESYRFVLQPGTADADFTVTTAIVNLHGNPSAESTTLWYLAGTGTSAIAVSTTVGGLYGAAALRGTTSAATSNILCSPNATGFTVTEGKSYVFIVPPRSQVSRSGTLNIQWRNAAGTIFQTDVSTGFLTSASWGDRFSMIATAPVGAVNAVPFFQTTGNSVGQFHYLDGVMFYEGTAVVPYFDGSTSTDTYYSYAWDGAVNASTSRRIRLDARDPKLLLQDPGEKDWDVVAQLVQAAGLRLFCDEQRRWYLIDPATYVVAGTVALAGAKRGRDRISREADDWCDAVVVIYSWIDTDGNPAIEYDVASAGGTLLLEVNIARPYPGPGAAAAILARYQNRGRVQEIVAPLDLDPTPGKALTTALPNTPDQEGFVSKVTWDLGRFDTTVTARELEDA